jgi:hypothetical protein
VQELATSALKGRESPLEAVQLKGEIHSYLATPIRNNSQTIKGILLIEYGTDWLDQLRQGAAAKAKMNGLNSISKFFMTLVKRWSS